MQDASDNNHYLSGWLFGFGEEEALQFHENQENSLENVPILRKSAMRIAGFNAESEERLLYEKNLKIEDLGIPSFTIFSKESESVNTFLRQRSQILKQLKGKNLAGVYRIS